MNERTGEPSGSPVVLRAATPADAPALARLRYEFRASMNPANEDEAAFLARAIPWMAGRLSPESAWRAWIALAGNEAVGCTWLQLIEKLPNPAPEREHHGYITSVFVRESARGTGLGAALVGAALAACRESAVDSVILWPTARSRALYARNGFALPDDIMELVLDPARDLH